MSIAERLHLGLSFAMATVGVTDEDKAKILAIVIEFTINFVLIFVTQLAISLLLLGHVPLFDELYMSVLRSLVPALMFLVANRGLKAYVAGGEPVPPQE